MRPKLNSLDLTAHIVEEEEKWHLKNTIPTKFGGGNTMVGIVFCSMWSYSNLADFI